MNRYFSLNPLRALALGIVAFLCINVMQPAHALEPRMTVFSKTYDPASVATTVQTSTTVTAPGAKMGDKCLASFSLDAALVDFTCYVSVAGTATVLVKNGSAGTVDLASGTVRVFIYPKGTR